MPAFRILLLSLGAGSIMVLGTDSEVHLLKSDRVDGIHQDLTAKIAPVEIGAIVVKLTSPSHTLEVLEHGLELQPLEIGVTAARLRLRYRGTGRILAEMEVGSLPARLEDQVELPEQVTDIAGSFEIMPQQGGYLVTVRELPSHVNLQVDSRLGGQLVLLCRGLAVLAWGGIDCNSLSVAFSSLRLPLPAPGKTYNVAAAALTEVERSQLDAYLASQLSTPTAPQPRL